MLRTRAARSAGWSTRAAEQSAALCDNQIDAMVYAVGHPSGSIQEATTACVSVLVEASSAEVEGLVADNSFYRTANIPGGMYRGNDGDTKTFGVGATFVTSADVSDEVVYTLVSSVFENIDDFRGLHPAFANLDPAGMATLAYPHRCIPVLRSTTANRAGSNKRPAYDIVEGPHRGHRHTIWLVGRMFRRIL